MAIEEPPAIKGPKDAWYAIYAKHQHEKSAADLLAHKGFEILLPLYRSIRRWKDRDKSVLSPLFPNYLFVRTDLSRKVDILRTPGVFWLVESGGCACHIPDADIQAINKIVQSPASIAPHPYLKSGEWVRVRRGSLEGILIRFKNQYRVVLTVEPLRKAVAIEVDLSAIEPLPGNDPNAPPRNFFAGGPAGNSEARPAKQGCGGWHVSLVPFVTERGLPLVAGISRWWQPSTLIRTCTLRCNPCTAQSDRPLSGKA